jgi:hypothetical protein
MLAGFIKGRKGRGRTPYALAVESKTLPANAMPGVRAHETNYARNSLSQQRHTCIPEPNIGERKQPGRGLPQTVAGFGIDKTRMDGSDKHLLFEAAAVIGLVVRISRGNAS